MKHNDQIEADKIARIAETMDRGPAFDRKDYARTVTEEVAAALPGFVPASDPRRRCRHCGAVMKPFYHFEDVPRDTPPGPGVVYRFVRPERVARVRHYGYDSRQLFCTLRCGYAYGVRAAATQEEERPY